MKTISTQDAIKRIKEFGLHHAIGDLPHSTFTVEAFKMAIDALEKQIPQDVKVYVDGLNYDINTYCPRCNCGVTLDYYTQDGYGYCQCCGQHVKRRNIKPEDIMNPVNLGDYE